MDYSRKTKGMKKNSERTRNLPARQRLSSISKQSTGIGRLQKPSQAGAQNMEDMVEAEVSEVDYLDYNKKGQELHLDMRVVRKNIDKLLTSLEENMNDHKDIEYFLQDSAEYYNELMAKYEETEEEREEILQSLSSFFQSQILFYEDNTSVSSSSGQSHPTSSFQLLEDGRFTAAWDTAIKDINRIKDINEKLLDMGKELQSKAMFTNDNNESPELLDIDAQIDSLNTSTYDKSQLDHIRDMFTAEARRNIKVKREVEDKSKEISALRFQKEQLVIENKIEQKKAATFLNNIKLAEKYIQELRKQVKSTNKKTIVVNASLKRMENAYSSAKNESLRLEAENRLKTVPVSQTPPPSGHTPEELNLSQATEDKAPGKNSSCSSTDYSLPSIVSPAPNEGHGKQSPAQKMIVIQDDRKDKCELPKSDKCELPNSDKCELPNSDNCELPNSDKCELPNSDKCELPNSSNERQTSGSKKDNNLIKAKTVTNTGKSKNENGRKTSRINSVDYAKEFSKSITKIKQKQENLKKRAQLPFGKISIQKIAFDEDSKNQEEVDVQKGAVQKGAVQKGVTQKGFVGYPPDPFNMPGESSTRFMDISKSIFSSRPQHVRTDTTSIAITPRLLSGRILDPFNTPRYNADTMNRDGILPPLRIKGEKSQCHNPNDRTKLNKSDLYLAMNNGATLHKLDKKKKSSPTDMKFSYFHADKYYKEEVEPTVLPVLSITAPVFKTKK